MLKKKRLEKIVSEYYEPILRYCLQLLKQDIYAAEDCTQEVFLLLTEKQDSLDLDANIRGWLYAAAQRICKEYLKKKQQQMTRIVANLEDMQDVLTDAPFADIESAFDVLTDEEYRMLEAYYTAEYGQRGQLAAHYNMTPVQLSKKIRTIREKLSKHLKKEE